MYSLWLEAPPILKDFGQLLNAMAKKTSGKKPSIRHPGRRRIKPGPKPKEEKGEPFCLDKYIKQQHEKTIKSHEKDTENEKMFRVFRGWKSLHEGFQQMLLTGVCSCEACLQRRAFEEAWENRISYTESEILFGDPMQNAAQNRIWGPRGFGVPEFYGQIAELTFRCLPFHVFNCFWVVNGTEWDFTRI